MAIFKVAKVFSEDRDLLRAIAAGPGLSALVPIVSALVLPDSGDPKRAIRLKLPPNLREVIHDAIGEGERKTGNKFAAVLIQAARRYREMHPLPKDWTEPDQADYGKAERERRKNEADDLERKPIVLRLDENDRELLQNLGRGRREFITRHGALSELVEIVREMHKEGEFDQISQRRRRSVHIAVPADLDAAIREKIGETRTYLTTLLAAAREYRRQTDDVTK